MDDVQAASTRPDLPQRGKDKEWERKQRLREYRVAARREKRNRKSDEKKQRKLNATILRRMTRNPDKYNKNVERNRLREIEGERRRIWSEALQQAQRLAAVHDPTGATFNVGPVVTQEDGKVVSVETLRRRKEQELARQAKKEGITSASVATNVRGSTAFPESNAQSSMLQIGIQPARDPLSNLQNGINPARLAQMDIGRSQQAPQKMSKTQQRKRAALEPRPPPPKPIIPEGVNIPDGEESWLSLWNLSDDQLERRVLREKKRKAAERKALRLKQKSGKAERRAARDEKRKVYRELKMTWKAIKEEETRLKTRLTGLEREEAKKIAVEINAAERKAAMECCAALGFTLENTPGVADIKPKALGMKGVEVDFDSLEMGETQSDLKKKTKGKRVDLGVVPEEAKTRVVSTGHPRPSDDPGEFIKLDVGDGQDFQTLDYNHKLRRKLRRAIENAEIQKEMLVRQRALEYCTERNIEHPVALKASPKPVNVRGQRVLEDGTLETAKRERVRMRMELAEFNKAARVLRGQAKRMAMEAGLRVHAELTGTLPRGIKLGRELGPRESDNSAAAKTLNAPEGSLDSARDRGYALAQGAHVDSTSGQIELAKHKDELAEGDKIISTNKKKRKITQCLTAEDGDVEMLDDEPAWEATSVKRRKESQVLSQSARQGAQESGNSQDQDNIPRWNVQSLSWDDARRDKFMRLLGAASSGKATPHAPTENDALRVSDISIINSELERQYEASMRIKYDGKKKGLGS